MSDFLQRIVDESRGPLLAEMARVQPAEMAAAAERFAGAHPCLDLTAAMTSGAEDDVRLMAEMKPASPSQGELGIDKDAAVQAVAYASSGADAVSILTQPLHFKGSFENLDRARDAVSIPILCKDFVFEKYQVEKARCHGADAILLIVGALSDAALIELTARARELGMAALVELHYEDEVGAALASGTDLFLVNNRDLRTLETDLETTQRLAPMLADGGIVISASGIQGAGDIRRLAESGVRSFLVGTALMRAPEPGALIRELKTALRGDAG